MKTLYSRTQLCLTAVILSAFFVISSGAFAETEINAPLDMQARTKAASSADKRPQETLPPEKQEGQGRIISTDVAKDFPEMVTNGARKMDKSDLPTNLAPEPEEVETADPGLSEAHSKLQEELTRKKGDMQLDITAEKSEAPAPTQEVRKEEDLTFYEQVSRKVKPAGTNEKLRRMARPDTAEHVIFLFRWDMGARKPEFKDWEFKPEHEFTFASAQKPSRFGKRAAWKLKELVEQRTAGRIRINVIEEVPKKANDYNILSSLNQNEIQMGQVWAHSLSFMQPEFEVLQLPFLFQSYEHIDKVLAGAIGSDILDLLGPYGYKGLAFPTGPGGYKIIGSPKKNHFLTHPEDFEGLDYYATEGRTNRGLMELLKTNPTPGDRTSEDGTRLTRQEAYAQGDDSINYIEGSFAQLENETLLHKKAPMGFTLSYHNYETSVLLMRKDAFDALPTGYQTILSNAAREAAAYDREMAQRYGQFRKKFFEFWAYYLQEWSPETENRFRKAVAPLYEQVLSVESLKELAVSIKKAGQGMPENRGPGDEPPPELLKLAEDVVTLIYELREKKE